MPARSRPQTGVFAIIAREWGREDRSHCAVRVQGSVEVNRPLHEVFDYVSNVGNYPNWVAHALEVRTDTPGPPRQSDRFIVAIKSVGRRFETPYERLFMGS